MEFIMGLFDSLYHLCVDFITSIFESVEYFEKISGQIIILASLINIVCSFIAKFLPQYLDTGFGEIKLPFSKSWRVYYYSIALFGIVSQFVDLPKAVIFLVLILSICTLIFAYFTFAYLFIRIIIPMIFSVMLSMVSFRVEFFIYFVYLFIGLYALLISSLACLLTSFICIVNVLKLYIPMI